ncbi:hypothetical protein SAMN05444008_11284 [Cnuella takakiae]|uniref:Uncharacterized protein n=1 Tax=Cnuella takakiae TaxID=1302690 RepID=A0A1M5EKA5_9BACT|nr:hypothetical protein BUE76_04320 [Cnuella takakiae]SHF79743.1 hypothetical protein SAMN05444008_11284 [Cnuella takakiae]
MQAKKNKGKPAGAHSMRNIEILNRYLLARAQQQQNHPQAVAFCFVKNRNKTGINEKYKNPG